MKRLTLTLFAGFALVIGVATATAGGGNSDAAKACQQGGWQNLVRQDGSGFKNTGDCVSYAAQGGVLMAKPNLTLTGNGSATHAPITTAETVVYAGTYTNGSVPAPGATVGLTVFHGDGCATGTAFYTDPSYATTDTSGTYSKESGTPPGVGEYSAQTNVGSTLSNCINIPVVAAPAVSTPGSENFAGDDASSQPTLFSGGTIDHAAYASGASTPNGGAGGSILVSGPYFNAFTTGDGTHFLFTGWGVNSAKLTFANPVTSVQVEAMSNKTDIATHLTLTGYDASGNPVPGAIATGLDAGYNSVTLKITSPSANIKYFTIATDDPLTNPQGTVGYGLGFSNISWS